MRSLIVSSLVLSAAMLNAQSSSKGQAVALEARSEAPAAMTSPAADVPATPHALRVSTGVIAPKLISEPTVDLSSSGFTSQALASREMVVRLQLDKSGTPQDVQIVKAINPEVDARVITALRQYRFEPAKLNDEAVPMSLDLAIHFEQRR